MIFDPHICPKSSVRIASVAMFLLHQVQVCIVKIYVLFTKLEVRTGKMLLN